MARIAGGKKDALGEPGVAGRAIRALRRGAAVRHDLFNDWDFWPDFDRPLDEVRRDLGVPPA